MRIRIDAYLIDADMLCCVPQKPSVTLKLQDKPKSDHRPSHTARAVHASPSGSTTLIAFTLKSTTVLRFRTHLEESYACTRYITH